MNLIWWCLQ